MIQWLVTPGNANTHTHATFPISYTNKPIIVGNYYGGNNWVVPSGENAVGIVFPSTVDFYFGSQGGSYCFITIGY